jgi:hypothetical protein
MQRAVVQQASRNTAHVSVASCLEEEEEETAVGNWRMGTSYSGRMGSCIKRGGGGGGRDLLPSTILLLTILLDMLNQET